MRILRRWFCTLSLVAWVIFALPVLGQETASPDPYAKNAQELLEKGLGERGAYEILKDLFQAAPNRLSGSPGAAQAVQWGRKKMESLGLEQVRLEPVTVPAWSRGRAAEALVLLQGGAREPLSICALGNSPGTPPQGITAPMVEVQSIEELKGLGKKAEGKIIFFNRPMNRASFNPFPAYGAAADQRFSGPAEAGRYGAAAVLVRSLTDRSDDYPHTGMTHYEEDAPKIPAAAVSTQDADILHRLLRENPDARIRLKMDCSPLPDAPSHNVLGQITGTENPAEIILLGCHLDAWDLGPGAQDDGGGCAQVLEALRLIKALDLKPKRTVRGVLFMCEEFGGAGGEQYASSDARKREKHLAAIESDSGAGLPLGFGVHADSKTIEELQKWMPAMKELGLFYIRKGYGGVDIGPLRNQGTIPMGLQTNPQRYFDVQHSAADTLETVSDRELELGAVSMAAFAYILAEEGLPPDARPAQGHDD